MKLQVWKKNLAVCWFGMFMVGVGFSQIAPLLPLYVQQLGVANMNAVARLSGFAFGITYVASALFAPVWGTMADRVGCRPMMLRASLGMAVILAATGLVTNVYALIVTRVLLGVISGFNAACITLISSQVGEGRAGWAMGVLSTSYIAGALIGPTMGGVVADHLGIRVSFFITGALLMLSFVSTYFFVEESFVPRVEKAPSTREIIARIPEKGLTVSLCLTSFMLSLAIFSAEPIVTVYVSTLVKGTHDLALLSGLVFSVSGLATIATAPNLGKLSDRYGPEKIMLIALLFAGIVFIPQAFVRTLWQLMALRFMVGLAAGGLNPSLNVMLKKITPAPLTGSVFGLATAASSLGVFGGSVLGGQVAADLGIRYVFIVTAALLLLNVLMAYFSVYKKLTVPIACGGTR